MGRRIRTCKIQGKGLGPSNVRRTETINGKTGPGQAVSRAGYI